MVDEPTPTAPPPLTDPVDVAAPYGYTTRGTPRRRPARSAEGRPRRGTAPGPAPVSSSRARPRSTGPDYRGGIVGLLQMVAAPLTVAGVRQPVLALDGWAIAHHADSVATAMQSLATERPEVAAVLDKVLQVGPYGLVIAAVSAPLVQILANHEVIPGGMAQALGALPPDQLMAAMTAPQTPDAP